MGWPRHPPGLRSAERRSVLEVALANGWPSGRQVEELYGNCKHFREIGQQILEMLDRHARYRIDTKSTRSRGTCVKR